MQLGTTCCPQRHSLLCKHRSIAGSRLVPETFLFDRWASQQPSNSGRPQHQHQQQQQPHQAASAQSWHHVDFSAAQAAIDSSGSSTDGSGFGASAKQLLQTAVHSLDMFEPREASESFEEDAMESLEEAGLNTGPLATGHIVKANYEVGMSLVSIHTYTFGV